MLNLSHWGRGALALGCLIGFTGSAIAAPKADVKGKHVAGELIVKFKDGATDQEIADGLKKGRLKIKKHVQSGAMKRRGHIGVTQVQSDLGTEAALETLQNDPAVEYAEPNYIYEHQAVSNDPYVTGNSTWGLYGDLSTPANVYGSQAAEAWAQGYTGSSGVFVAVIDEGIDVSHPDLVGNVWVNPFDPVDGVDNDGNGYADDVNGWNFYSDNRQVYTAGGDTHGTHVAGTIGARGGNGSGVAGVNWNVTMISGKFLGAGGGNTMAAVEAIDYFIDLKQRHGLNLVAINASWGGGGYSQSLHDAINRAGKAGIMFIAAAGNSTLNNDVSAAYPANYDTRQGTSTESAASYDAVISVAAIDSNGALASFSNYGATRVDIGAPGVRILSTYPGAQLVNMNGTSMAAPHVTGAVALYASTHPGATGQIIRNAILGSALPTPSLAGRTVTGGRLNLSSIVAPVVQPPAAPAGLTATAGNASIALQWNSVSGATSYAVHRSTTAGGGYATIAGNLAGTTFTDSAVNNGTRYFYIVTAANTGGTSVASAEVSATPQAPVVAALPAPTGVNGVSSQSTLAGLCNVMVRWTPVAGATNYKIGRSASATGPFTQVASGVTGSSYVNSNVPADGTRYYYTVTAVNSSSESQTSAAGIILPNTATPANAIATALSSTQVSFRWLDRTADEQGFIVEQWNGSAWVVVTNAAANISTVTISGLSSKTSYSFRVRAFKDSAYTAYSNTANVVTL